MSQSEFDYDLFVIGAGSGGVRASRIAAGHGARVAVAEEFRIGGTCVIRGCVPKKLLVYASQVADDLAHAGAERLALGLVDDLSVAARPRWPLDEAAARLHPTHKPGRKGAKA